MFIQEEISSVKGRMEFIVVASNERQKELESMWSTVKNLDETAQSLTVQIKQQNQEIEFLLKEEDPMILSRRYKVSQVFAAFILCSVGIYNFLFLF